MAPSEHVAVRPVRGLCCSYCTPLSWAVTVVSTADVAEAWRGRQLSEAGRQQLSEAGGRCPCCGAPRLHSRSLYPQAGTCSSPAGLLTLALEVGVCARLEVAEVPGCDEGAAGAVGARDLGAKQLPIRGLHKCGHKIHCRTAAGAAGSAGSAGSARLSSLQRARTGLGDARLSRPW